MSKTPFQKLLVCIVLYGAFSPLSLFGQEYNFRPFGVGEGLPQSQINTIFQDSLGYLWFGTSGGGVAQFDGNDFTSFNENDGLINNTIRAIADLSNERIYGTDLGLSVTSAKGIKNYTISEGLSGMRVDAVLSRSGDEAWIGTSHGITHYQNQELRALTTNTSLDTAEIRSFTKTSEGAIWITTTSSGLFIWKDGIFSRFNHFPKGKDPAIRFVLETQDGTFWLGSSEQGLYKLVDDITSEVALPPALTKAYFTCSVADPDGRLWFGTWGSGLLVYNEGRFLHMNKSNGVPDNVILSLACDIEGNVWVGTFTSGAAMFLGEMFQRFDMKHGLPDNDIRALHQDDDGSIWVATLNGLARFDGEKFESFKQQPGLPVSRLGALESDHTGNIWIGGYTGHLSKFQHGKGFKFLKQAPGEVLSLRHAGDGLMWIGTHKAGLIKCTPGKQDKMLAKELKGRSIWSIHEDHEKKIWLATDKGVFQIIDEKIIRFERDSILSNCKIYSIAQDEQNNIYFGTYGKGIIRYNPEIQSIEHITTSDGLNNNFIKSVSVQKNRLLIASISGISSLDLVSYEADRKVVLDHFGKNAGVGGAEYSPNAVLRDRQDRLWFGTNKGIILFNPHKKHVKRRVQETLLTGVKLFSENAVWEDWADSIDVESRLPIDLELPSDQNHLTFGFKGINFFSPTKVLYQLKLEGFDTDWSTPGNANFATYSNLPPGNYTFMVRAGNKTEIQNNPTTAFSFTIKNPFWKSIWFFLIIVFVLIFFGFIVSASFMRSDDEALRQNSFNFKPIETGRVLLLFGCVVYSVAGYLYHFLIPELETPYWEHLVLSGFLFFWYLSSFRFEWVRSNISRIVEFGYYLLVLHVLYLNTQNDLHPVYVTGLILVISSSSIIINKLPNLIVFSSIITVLALSISFLIDIPQFNVSLFIVGVVISCLISLLLLISRQNLFKQLYFSDTIINNTNNLVIAANKKGEIIFANKKVKDLLGYSAEEVLGNGWWHMRSSDPEERQAIRDKIVQRIGFENGTGEPYDTLLKTKNGEDRWFQWVNSSLSGGIAVGVAQDITDRKESKAELEQLSLIASKTNNGVILSDAEGRIEWFNDSYTKITGYTLSELKGLRPGDVISTPASAANTIQASRIKVKQGDAHEFEIPAYDKSGKLMWLSIANTPVKDETGKVVQQIEIINDVTEKKAYEEQLEQLSLVASKTDNYVIITDSQDKVTWVNEGFTHITGYALEEIKGTSPASFLRGEGTYTETERSIDKKSKQSEPFREEIINYTKSGATVWLSMNVTPILAKNGAIEKYITIGSNITGQKEKERQLLELSMVANKAHDGIAIADRHGRVQWINEGYTRLTGYTLEDLHNKMPGDLMFGEDTNSNTQEFIREKTRQNKSFEKEVLIYTKSGQPTWLSLHNTAFTDQRDHESKQIGIISDITAKKKAEERLNYFVNQLEIVNAFDKTIMRAGSLQELMHNTIVDLNKKLGINMVSICLHNDATNTMTRTSLSHISGTISEEVIEQLDQYQDLSTLSNQLPLAVENLEEVESPWPIDKHMAELGIDSYLIHPLIAKNQLLGTLQLGKPIKNGFGDDLKAVISEVTNGLALALSQSQLQEDIVETNKQLAQRNKEFLAINQELKEFAYVVSHDLKAPLRAIGSLSDWLAQDYVEHLDESGQELLTTLRSRVNRMTKLIDGVLQYSKVGRIREQKFEVDTGFILDEVIKSLDPPNHIQIKTPASMPVVLAEETRMQQLFQNLIGNAIKYNDKEKGLIQVTCSETPTHWQFSIADNGPGIAKKNHERIFQIFQTLTSKDDAESTGVGLTIVKKIVELHGGEINVESELGNGTIFHFTLQKKNHAVTAQDET